MDPTVRSILFTIGAYLIGSIPMGLIVSQVIAGIDIREYGSGNIGMTNVYRALKKSHGHLPWVMTFVLDFAKGYLPVFFALKWLGNGSDPNPLFSYYIALVVIAVILGNMFSIYIFFRGGKGIATGFGIFSALIGVYVFIPLGVFLIFLIPTGIMSVASIAASITMPITCYLMGSNGWGIFKGGNADMPPLSPNVITVSVVIVALFIIFRHKENIKRLFAGTENRLWSLAKSGKKSDQDKGESEPPEVKPDGD